MSSPVSYIVPGKVEGWTFSQYSLVRPPDHFTLNAATCLLNTQYSSSALLMYILV